MAVVSFTLDDEGVVAFQNALACILRFSEDVSLEARRDKLVLSALNTAKSAFVSFTFAATHFFRYKFECSVRTPDRFSCQLYIRSLMSIFRNRTGAAVHGDSSIERCDVSIDDGPDTKSRFVAKIAWANGITATHAIPFESKSPVVARFDESKADNRWSISAQTLRRLMEHFGPKVELLDINTEGNHVVNLTCFTEKQYTKIDGISTMNLHTSIAVKMDDFDNIDVEDKHHIIINVKDFRAIIQHACTTTGNISAHYSEPWKPLRFSYCENGLLCQFVLMTFGSKGESAGSKKPKSRTRSTGTPKPSALSAGPFPPTMAPTEGAGEVTVSAMPPPVQRPKEALPMGGPAGQKSTTEKTAGFEMRPPPIPPSVIRMEALLDEDSQWKPVNPDEEDPDFVQIEWDESLQPELTFVPISDSRTAGSTPGSSDVSGGLDPTQRLTQVREFGLFN